MFVFKKPYKFFEVGILYCDQYWRVVEYGYMCGHRWRHDIRALCAVYLEELHGKHELFVLTLIGDESDYGNEREILTSFCLVLCRAYGESTVGYVYAVKNRMGD